MTMWNETSEVDENTWEGKKKKIFNLKKLDHLRKSENRIDFESHYGTAYGRHNDRHPHSTNNMLLRSLSFKLMSKKMASIQVKMQWPTYGRE